MQESTLRPLRERAYSLSQQVYDELLGAIVERRLMPGERLMLDDLAAQLRVSRTPVREALSRLAMEGLVKPVGSRGMCVTALTATDLRNLSDLRLVCELHAVEKGVGAVTEALAAHMEETARECSRLCRSTDPACRTAWAKKDRQFHSLIIGLADNPWLSELFDRLNIQAQHLRVGPMPLGSEALSAVHLSEHMAIVEALRLRDLPLAQAAIRAHVHNAVGRATAWLEG
ncbi:MAG: GntR family transcriptional regulator [Chloroflexota bacterium]